MSTSSERSIVGKSVLLIQKSGAALPSDAKDTSLTEDSLKTFKGTVKTLIRLLAIKHSILELDLSALIRRSRVSV